MLQEMQKTLSKSNMSRQSSEAEAGLEKKQSKQPQTGREMATENSYAQKALIERMEALDLEEEQYYEEHQTENESEWCDQYRKALKRHLSRVVDRHTV